MAHIRRHGPVCNVPQHWRPTHNGLRRVLRLAAVLCFTAVASCASVPDMDDLIEPAAAQGDAARVVGPHGPLTAAQSKAILERLQREAGNTDILQRHLAIESAIADGPLIAGNKVTVLRDGPATFAAMFKAIRGAEHYVDLEYYIFEDVEEGDGGQRLGDLLVEKLQQGVQVNIIYDGFGSISTPAAFFERLEQAGANVLKFNPINPAEARTTYSINDRDHRKILVADGRTGIVGGINLSGVYRSSLSSPSASSGREKNRPEIWHDTDLQIDGPAVAELQKLFLATWEKQSGKPLDGRREQPPVPAQGADVVRIVGSTPDHVIPQYYAALLSAIRNAETRIWLTTAYFVPTHQEVEDLADAARRGVEVKLLLPGESDSKLALAVGRSRYEDLLEAGVQIYETQGAIQHSKAAVIDGVWSVVGSSNFDHRSVLFNDEVDAIVLGRDSAAQLEAMFRDSIAAAKQIDPQAWAQRPLTDRIEEVFSRVWQSLL